MMLRARLGSILATLVLACGDDGSPQGATEDSTADGGSTAATTSEPTTSEPTTSEPTTSEPTTSDGSSGGSTDPDGSSGGTPGGTPGCGMDVAPGETVVQTTVGAAEREYLLVVPDGYDPSTPTPLVFAWHGRGGSYDLARLYFGVEQASGGQAIFVYPQGLPIESMGGQTGWDLAPTGIDVDFFDAMLAETSSALCIDPERVFTTGHSFGGYMSNALACFRASALRAMGSVAGGPPFGACEADSVAAWITHGTEDQVVPFSQGEASRDSILARNGCGDGTAAVDPVPCEAYDGCAEGLPVVWCAHSETDLMGHVWPDYAGAAIWAFFEGLPPKP